MIEQLTPAPSNAGLALRLRPNRSASPALLVAFFSGLGLTMMAVAWFAASQGNVFAPLFAAVDIAVVGFCFWKVRRGAQCEETIALSAEAVIVRRRPGGPETRFHPYWVKFESEPGRTRNEPVKVVLRSHGRSVEIGAFLGEEEREELRDRLSQALAAARAGAFEFEPG